MQKSPDLAFNMRESVLKKFDNINIVRKEGKEKVGMYFYYVLSTVMCSNKSSSIILNSKYILCTVRAPS